MFGMTMGQLAVLGVLALMALVTIFGGFFFITRTMSGGSFSASGPTVTPFPTITPYVTQTPTLTPTATLIPYENLIPTGWKQHTTETIELWIPPEFKTVDIDRERKARIKLYEDLGYDDVAEDLENIPPAYVFWFKHSDPGANLFSPNITVEPITMTADNLDAFINEEYKSQPQEFVVVNKQEIRVGDYEARRLLLEANLSNIYMGVAQYAIYDGSIVWIINCGTHFNEFYTYLPEFDKIARTFRLIGQ